jgi:hypothetical protein
VLLALSAAQTTFGQAPAFAKAQGLWTEQVQAAAKKAEQSKQPVQQALFVPQGDENSGVEPVGYPAAAYPADCPPGGFGWGGHSGYGHPSHPGHLFNGGRYGYFGGAHRTPGYPHHHQQREYCGPQGPPSAQVAYPYYTIRGPRDFFLDNPPSIGR